MDIDLEVMLTNIERLRQRMIYVAAVKESFIDQEVIEASRELDVLIVDYLRFKLYMGR